MASGFHWKTRWPQSRWCGASTQLPFRDGTVYVTCTRFKGHLESDKVREPLKHFDELKKRHWYDESQPQSGTPTEPCEPPSE